MSQRALRDDTNKLVHVIGGGDVVDSQVALETALELVIGRPGQWHSALEGQVPRRVMCDGSVKIETWLSSRDLQPVVATAVDEIMMGLVLSRDRSSGTLVSFYLEIGIPVVVVDLEDLNIFALNEQNLALWFDRKADSHHNLENSGGASEHFPVESERGAESHFLAGSDTMLSETVGGPTLALRDGDRCKFTRSRVVKAG